MQVAMPRGCLALMGFVFTATNANAGTGRSGKGTIGTTLLFTTPTTTTSTVTSIAFSDASEISSPESWTELCLGLVWPLFLRDYSDCLAKGTTCAGVLRSAVDNGCGCHPLLTPFLTFFEEQQLEDMGLSSITCPNVSFVSDRGCAGKTDAEVLGQRLALFLNETRAFITIGEDIGETLVAAAHPDAHLFWPMIGKYVGHEEMKEYIRIGDWTLNQGWFQPLSFQGDSINVAVGHDHFWLNATVQFAFFGNLSDREWQPVVNGLTYQDTCDVQYVGHFYNLVPDPLQAGRMPFGERMSTTGMSYHGPHWVCNTIMQSCTGAYAQFANVTECLQYLGGLPIIDPRCATTGQFGMGASQRCKLIHLFMTEASPERHCAHVGSRYDLDSAGTRKCYPDQCLSTLVETTTSESTNILTTRTTTFAVVSTTATLTTQMNKQCSSWCSSVQDWRKCEWENCNGCADCVDFVVQSKCRFWCYLYPYGQQQRTCTWSKCGSCPFCALDGSTTTATTTTVLSTYRTSATTTTTTPTTPTSTTTTTTTPTSATSSIPDTQTTTTTTTTLTSSAACWTWCARTSWSIRCMLSMCRGCPGCTHSSSTTASFSEGILLP